MVAVNRVLRVWGKRLEKPAGLGLARLDATLLSLSFILSSIGSH